MTAYEMVSSNRSAITIDHQDGNYYVISAHRPGDEEPSDIYLTVPQMPELARMLTDYVVGMIPLHGLGPDDRFEFENVLAALRDYLRAELPYEAMASQGHGVIAALPSRGKIEWRVEMREQIATARRLPAQLWSEAIGIELDQHQPSARREVPARGLLDLGARRQMDEAIHAIDRRAVERSRHLGGGPFLARADLVEPGHGTTRTAPVMGACTPQM